MSELLFVLATIIVVSRLIKSTDISPHRRNEMRYFGFALMSNLRPASYLSKQFQVYALRYPSINTIFSSPSCRRQERKAAVAWDHIQ